MLIHEIITEMRTDSSEYHRLDSADQWLAKYTYEALDKWPSKSVLKELVKRYPADPGTVIYRGLNFDTKEAYDEFRASISDGKLTQQGISSWAPSAEAAWQFAVTKPTYFLNAAVMQAYSDQQKNKERLSGYRGIIISVTVDDQCAIDVRKSDLGHEAEIILLPGAYSVTISREVKRFKDEVQDGTDINQHILDMSREDLRSDNDRKQFYDYILHHHVAVINEQARKHLFTLLKPDGLSDIVHVRVNPADRYNKIDKLSISFRFDYFGYAINNVFNPRCTAIAKKDATNVIKKVISVYKEYPDYIVEQGNISEIAKFAGLNSQYMAALKDKVGKQYSDLEKKGRDINKMANSQRANALKDHVEMLRMVLGQIK